MTAGGTDSAKPTSPLPDYLAPIDVLPKQINRTTDAKADYPIEARQGLQGVVRFRILVGSDGSIKKAFLIKGLPLGLTEESVKALKKLKVEPGKDAGQNVDYWMPIQFSFILY